MRTPSAITLPTGLLRTVHDHSNASLLEPMLPRTSTPSWRTPQSHDHYFKTRERTSKSKTGQGTVPNTSRYPCLWPNCEFTAARAYDLGKHLETHTPETSQRLDCPYARNGFCGRMGERGFTREDHRKEHIRMVHPRPR